MIEGIEDYEMSTDNQEKEQIEVHENEQKVQHANEKKVAACDPKDPLHMIGMTANCTHNAD